MTSEQKRSMVTIFSQLIDCFAIPVLGRELAQFCLAKRYKG